MSSKFTIGQNIRRLRVLRGYSQLQMAMDMSISASNLCHIERGTGNPTVETLDAIADHLDIPAISLYESWRNRIDADDLCDYPQELGASYVYYFVPELVKCPYIGRYLTYGIKCSMIVKNESIYIGMIHDVDINPESICDLIIKLHRNQVHPAHLYDVIEDELWWM